MIDAIMIIVLVLMLVINAIQLYVFVEIGACLFKFFVSVNEKLSEIVFDVEKKK